MQAVRVTAWQSEPEIREVPVPEPAADQVLLKVAGAGACHSDLHVMEWPAGTLPYPLPFTLGHETGGWVETVGAGVTAFRPGDAVLVYGPWGCGVCRRCAQGAENYCERAAEIGAAGGGLGRDGGMAGGLGATLVLDIVGAQSTMDTAAAAAAPLGEITILGLAGGHLPIAFGAVPWECPVSVPYWGTRPELAEVVALARQGRVTVRTEMFSLDEARTVYRRMRDGELTGRAVFLPHA